MDLLHLLDGSSSETDDELRGEVTIDGSADAAGDDADDSSDAAADGSTGGTIPAPTRRKSKRRRGSVEIIPSSIAPPDAFLRSIPHRRGHWSGHVKIDIPTIGEESTKTWTEHKERSVEKFRALLERNGYSGIVVIHEELHLSLSKHFSLPLACVEPFVKQLTELIRHERCAHIQVNTEEGHIMTNELESRSFWCWTVPTPNAMLTRMVKHVDTVLTAYNQPLYYEPPRFHISIASFPGHLRDLVENDECNRERKLNKVDTASLGYRMFESFNRSSMLVLPVTKLTCTFGSTKEFTIMLKAD